MTTTEYPMVVGVFRDHTQAAQAIDELHSVGCRRQIEETKPFSDTIKREEVHIERVGKVHIQGSDEDGVS